MAREYVELHNVKIMDKWKNFSGAQRGQYNTNGKRYFDIILDEDRAEELRDRGLNVKEHTDMNGENPIYTLQAVIRFSPYPPDEIFRIIPKGKIRLTEDTIYCLDNEEIDHIDVKLNLSHWEMGKNSGITPYVTKLAVWVNEDNFSNSYRDIPEIGGVSVDPSYEDFAEIPENEIPF